MPRLTPKEYQMIRFLLKGYSNKGIEEELDISPNTVKTHLNSIFTKMDVKGRKELISDLFY